MNRAFRSFWLVNLLSNLGDGFLGVFVALMILEVSDDPVIISLASVVCSVPWLLLGALAGVVADRFDRPFLIVISAGARTLLLVGFGLMVQAGMANVPFVLGATLALLVCEPFSDTAVAALIPVVAGRAHLAKANARLQVTQRVAQSLLALPLGTFLFSCNPAWVMWGAAVMYTGTIGACLVVRQRLSPEARGGADGNDLGRAEARGGAWAMVSESLCYIRGNRLLWLVVALQIGMTFASAIANAVGNLYTIEHFGIPVRWFGVFTLVPLVASLVGAKVGACLVERHGALRTLGAVIVPCAVAMLAYAGWSGPVAGVATVLVSGVLGAVSSLTLPTLLQLLTPEAMLGRVQGALGTLTNAVALCVVPLGGVLARVDLRLTYAVGGALAVALGVAFVVATRQAAAQPSLSSATVPAAEPGAHRANQT
jgi:MFS family permease